MPFGLASRKRVKALAARVAHLDDQRQAMAAQIDRVTASVDCLASDVGELKRRLNEDAAERQRQGEALRAAAADVHALKDRASSLAASLDEQHRAAAEAVEKHGRTTADLSAAIEEQGRARGELAAAFYQRQNEALEEVRSLDRRLDAAEQRGDQRERTVDQIRADVTRIERQSAIDLALLRSTDEALARAVTRANAPADGITA